MRWGCSMGGYLPPMQYLKRNLRCKTQLQGYELRAQGQPVFQH